MSADGRFVAFESFASNLVAGDTNGTFDVFVRDRLAGVTRRVSVGVGGQANRFSLLPAMSADGRIVAFYTPASNLVAGGHQREVRRVRPGSAGRGDPAGVGRRRRQANGGSCNPAISANGRSVAFESNASNLVRGDTNAVTDVFVRDPLLGPAPSGGDPRPGPLVRR